MRSYERNGVTVDQCGDCRGNFLDRGELECLVDAENRWRGQAQEPAQQAPQVTPAPPGSPDPSYQQPYQQPSYGHHKPHKRRKSFFEELFD